MELFLVGMLVAVITALSNAFTARKDIRKALQRIEELENEVANLKRARGTYG